jgi:hypothetical protein
MSNDVIISLETLYRDARDSVSSVSTKSQRQQLALSYLSSLLRLRDAQLMALEEMRDEVAIALCMRAPPIFGFIEKVCDVQKPAVPSLKLDGRCQNRFALRGEVHNQFGSPASKNHAVVPKGQLVRVG